MTAPKKPAKKPAKPKGAPEPDAVLYEEMADAPDAAARARSLVEGNTVTLYARERDNNILRLPAYVTRPIPTMDDLPLEIEWEIDDVIMSTSRNAALTDVGIQDSASNFRLGMGVGLVVARHLGLVVDLHDARLTRQQARELSATLWLLGLRVVASRTRTDPNATGG